MGFLDKLVAGGQKPPPYSNKPTNVNHSNEPSKMNPYPSVTSPVTPNTPNYLAGSANNQAPSSSDERPLPPGWVKQWHDGYQRFFYVDTNAVGGPQSHWIHPSDQQPGQGQQRAGFGQPPMAQQPYYPQQYPQQPMYPQQPPQMMANNGRGRGGFNPLLAGAGGLAGGMLLGSMLGDHHGYEQGYDQGYDNGYDNGFDNGDMFGGGGDFGGF